MSLYNAFKEIFAFFFKQELKSKRTRIFFLISFLPVLIMIAAKIIELSHPDPSVTAEDIFSRALLIFYIQFLIPTLALFFGSSIINEEIDNKTLVFLTTSPIPKPSIIFGKYVAYVLLGSIIVNAGLCLSFLTVNIDRLNNVIFVKEFLSFIGAGFLGLIAYMSLFALLGSIMKKAGVVLGLSFIFGWENIVQYFPGATQKLTIIHWIKSMLPRVSEGNSFLKFLTIRLEPSSTVESVLVLTIFVIVTLIAASVIFNKKEYILSDSL